MDLRQSDRNGIRNASNYQSFRDDLLTFDDKRFRGLGERNTVKFITQAVKVCDAYALYHYEGVLQVMKTMCFLGTHMMDDPRFEMIVATLRASTRYGDTRIEGFNKESRRFMTVFTGDKLVYYRGMLNTFLAVLEQPLEPRLAREKILRELPKHLRIQVEDWRPHLIQSAQHAMEVLDLNNARFQTFYLVASAVLGHRFYHDPLYPWVRELAAPDGASAPEVRAERLINFTSKRIRKQLMVLENYYGI